jgi:hypothetical protein
VVNVHSYKDTLSTQRVDVPLHVIIGVLLEERFNSLMVLLTCTRSTIGIGAPLGMGDSGLTVVCGQYGARAPPQFGDGLNGDDGD